jgi:hypothetical protein
MNSLRRPYSATRGRYSPMRNERVVSAQCDPEIVARVRFPESLSTSGEASEGVLVLLDQSTPTRPSGVVCLSVCC